MKLINSNTETNDNEIVTTYNFDQLTNVEDLKKFVSQIEQSFGKIGQIICKNIAEDKKIKFYQKYNSLEEFVKSFNDYEYGDSNFYAFYISENAIDLYLDIPTKKLTIVKSLSKRRSLEEMKNNVTYYIFDDSFVLKRNNETDAFYRKNDETGEWEEVDNMIDRFYDPSYKFEPIDEADALNYGRSK